MTLEQAASTVRRADAFMRRAKGRPGRVYRRSDGTVVCHFTPPGSGISSERQRSPETKVATFSRSPTEIQFI
jgi:hypothetical protein